MKMKVSLAIFLLLCIAAGAFFTGMWFGSHNEARKARHDLALHSYDVYSGIGFRGSFDGFDEVLWREELGEYLQDALAKPWTSAYPNDAQWGTAYRIVHDPGSTKGRYAHPTWAYTQGMSQGQQDDLIRYMCFRIEKSANVKYGPDGAEFLALVTYPREAINRNRDKITRAVTTGASGMNRGVEILSSAYIVQLADLDWARDVCCICTRQAADQPSNFYWWRANLDSEAAGGWRVGQLFDAGKPSPQAQAGAAQVVARLTQDPQQGSDFRAWRDELAAASRPATQPTK
jgi:hypothetical protein